MRERRRCARCRTPGGPPAGCRGEIRREPVEFLGRNPRLEHRGGAVERRAEGRSVLCDPLPQQVVESPGIRVRDLDRHLRQRFPAQKRRATEGFGDGRRVGAHQSAGAELHAAPVPRHDGDHVGQFAAEKHLQHRYAGGTRRLAVVRGARLISAQPGDHRAAVVPGIPRPLADAGDHGLCLRDRTDRLDARDESGLLDDDLVLHGGGDRRRIGAAGGHRRNDTGA